MKNRNFGTAVFLQLILGMVLFGSTVLIPQYLQTLLGYTAERAGMVLSPAGFVMMAGMAIAGRTLGKGDPRLMVMMGYIATAIGLYNLTQLDLYTSFGHATLWRMLQVIGLPFIFIPISTLNYVGVPREKSNQISSLSNFARNLGGSAGTALLTTYLARSAQVHQDTLAANLTGPSQALRNYISAYAAAAHLSFASAAAACHGLGLPADAAAGLHAGLQECIRDAGADGAAALAAGVDHAPSAQGDPREAGRDYRG